MSKVAAILFTVAGASVLSVGGVWMLKNRGGKIEEDLGFKTLSEFVSKKGGSCAKKYFGDQVDYSSKGDKIDTSSNNIQDNHFSEASGSGDAESCLVVNWEKKKETGENKKKGTGGFRWLWAFKRGTKGFVMFVTTKSTTTANTLDLEGGIYFLEQETQTKKGSIKKHKELESKSINSSNFDKSYPKAGTNIKSSIKDTEGVSDKSYWGFISDKNDLTDLCASGASDCPSDPSEAPTLKGVWVGTFSTTTADGKTPIKNGSETFDQGSDDLFKDVCLKTAISSFQGTGTKQ